MKVLLQVLKLCFWALPAQRVCTVTGAAVLAITALWLAPSSTSPQVAMWASLGVMLFFLPVLATGGPLWRAFSAQRAVALAPHGRIRLLLAAMAIAALGSAAIATYFWALYLWLPPQWRQGLGLAAWWTDVSGTFVLASWWAMASFLAARSLLATFTVLVLLLGGGLAVVQLDLPRPNEWLPGGGLSLTLICWIIFAAWYLRARRIRPSAWTSRRAEDEALVTAADTGGIGTQVSRAVALQRLMLGGRGMGRIILQWLLALGLLQGILAGIRAAAGVSHDQVAPLQFLGLVLVLPAMAALSWLVATRLRPLWLASGCSRAGLFATGERTLLMLAVGLAIGCVAAFLALWYGLPQHPEASLVFALCALLGPLLLPVYAALLHGQGGAVTYSTLVAVVIPAYFAAGAYLDIFMLPVPDEQWWWLAPLPVATIALRELARRRWLHADMPRAAASAPAS